MHYLAAQLRRRKETGKLGLLDVAIVGRKYGVHFNASPFLTSTPLGGGDYLLVKILPKGPQCWRPFWKIAYYKLRWKCKEKTFEA